MSDLVNIIIDNVIIIYNRNLKKKKKKKKLNFNRKFNSIPVFELQKTRVTGVVTV